jgi:hypothetical protein
MDDWEVSNPRESPFTQAELAQSENKRRTQDLRESRYRTWSRRIAQGKDHANGTFETLGAMDRTVTDFLENKGIRSMTNQIAITDRRILHMFRDSKKAGKRAVPQRYLRNLPALIENPLAVLWDKESKEPSLLYLFKIEGEQRLGKLVVKIKKDEKRSRHRRHNFLTTAGLVDRGNLSGGNRYETVRGVF